MEQTKKRVYESPDLLIMPFSSDDTIRTSGNGFEIWEDDSQQQGEQ